MLDDVEYLEEDLGIEGVETEEIVSEAGKTFADLTADKTPVNLALQKLVSEMMKRGMESDVSHNIGIEIRRMIKEKLLRNFTTMNMKILSVTIWFVNSLADRTVTPDVWNNKNLYNVIRTVLGEKKDIERHIVGVKQDMLRYVRHLWLAENPDKNYQDSLSQGGYTLRSVN